MIFAAAGVAAREPQRRHRRLGARRHEPHHLHATAAGGTASPPSRSRLRSARRTTGPCAAASLHRAHHRRMRVAEDRRPPRADVVDVALAVGVPQVRRPRPRAKKRGVPPTERNARTGELTPAGIVRCARAKSSSLRLSWCTLSIGRRSKQRRDRRAASARDARRGSSWRSNTAVITATRVGAGARPAPRALSAVMPPIATTGTPSAFARAQQRDVRAPRAGLDAATRRSCRTRRSRRLRRRRRFARAKIVVAGHADQHALRPDARARGGHVAVVLAQVHAVARRPRAPARRRR